MENIQLLIFLGVLVLILFIVYKIYSKFKIPKIGCLALVTGGVKTGKSTFAVYLAYVNYKRARRRWKIRAFFQNLFHLPVDARAMLFRD